MRPGQLMSFLVAAQTIQKSLANLSLMFGHYVKCVSTGGRIFYMLSLRPCIVTNEGIIHENFVGNVCFRRVNFSYPTRASHPVLREFNLDLQAGKVTALCGFSGAGKSTIALLLERFYDVQSGSITLDGIDVRSLDLHWLRSRAIGYINQEPTLFHTSILENIRYAKPDATDAQVIAAAQTANAHTFINKFPNGYQTVVGERGVTISGGQKQRIAIARAILKDPAILILDEATSALDAHSETMITQSLEKIMRNRTVLIIAHRLSTIRNADNIIVLNDGQVVEKGTHEELLALKGAYCSLMRQQQHVQKNQSTNA